MGKKCCERSELHFLYIVFGYLHFNYSAQTGARVVLPSFLARSGTKSPQRNPASGPRQLSLGIETLFVCQRMNTRVQLLSAIHVESIANGLLSKG